MLESSALLILKLKMTAFFKPEFTVYDTLIDQTLKKGIMHVKMEILWDFDLEDFSRKFKNVFYGYCGQFVVIETYEQL